MADLSLLKQYFKSYLITLKETSYDKENKIYLCQSQEKVIGFDKYIQNKNEKHKKSFDALHFGNTEVYCVEFKNQKYSEISSSEIKKKYIDGLKELSEVFKDKNLVISEYLFYLFVIFKNPTNNGAMTHYRKRFKEGEIDLGLESQRFFRKIKRNKINNPKNKVGCVNDFKQEYQRVFSCSSNC